MQRRSYSDRPVDSHRYERNGRQSIRSPRESDRSTHCESSYLYSLMQEGCELVFVLQQNETIIGLLAWYDESCVKVTPTNGAPSLVIPKRSLKYLYELREAVQDNEVTNGTNSIV